MILVISFMAISVPMITSALVLSGTLSKDSHVKNEILKRQYSLLGCDQYAQYIIKEDLPPGTYPCGINGETLDITIADVPPIVGPPPPADNSRRLKTSKSVTPTTAPVDTLTVYTYTVIVTNRDDEVENLNKIDDDLPPGFSYVAGSTTGVTTADPSVSGQSLTWNLSETLNPGDSVTLVFDAEAQVSQGNYCNNAWATPGGPKTGSELTAKVKVGSPADDLCPGEAVEVTKTVEVERGVFVGSSPLTFTYTITIENTGTSELRLNSLQDLLSPGFNFVPGTVSGSLTSNAPSIMMFQGRERLTWNFNPKIDVQPGSVETLTFDVQGVFNGGHWNEAWLSFIEFPHDIYTWPTAGVEVIEATESTTTTADGGTVYSLMWKIAPETFIQWQWEFSGS